MYEAKVDSKRQRQLSQDGLTAGHVARDNCRNLPRMCATQVHIAMRHVKISAARRQKFARTLGELDDIIARRQRDHRMPEAPEGSLCVVSEHRFVSLARPRC